MDESELSQLGMGRQRLCVPSDGDSQQQVILGCDLETGLDIYRADVEPRFL